MNFEKPKKIEKEQKPEINKKLQKELELEPFEEYKEKVKDFYKKTA